MDEELKAMAAIADALSGLDQEKRYRILEWAMSRFSSAPQRLRPSPASTTTSPAPGDADQWQTFGDLFHAAQPSGEKEKALIAAFWVQVVGRADSFGSQQLNAALKDLGYKISNITAALTQLQDERPALVIQLRKSGSSQQARKTYKLTDAGRRRTEELLARLGERYAKD